MLDMYCGVDEMSSGERKEFLTWYERIKSEIEAYSEDDGTVLRQACLFFRREFLHIGNIEVFLESQTIASACNN